MRDEVDAELVSFLHDLPEGATTAIEKITLAAAERGAKKASRSGWLRLFVQAGMLGAACVGGLAKYSDLPTKADITRLEALNTASINLRSARDETQNTRLSNAEYKCDQALTCCTHQANRLDLITSPARK